MLSVQQSNILHNGGMMPFYGMLITAAIVVSMLLLPPTIAILENSQQIYSYYSKGYALVNFETDISILSAYSNCTSYAYISGADSFTVLQANQSCIVTSGGLYWVGGR